MYTPVSGIANELAKAFGGDIAANLAQIEGKLRTAVKAIRVRSTVTPEIVVNDPFATKPPGPAKPDNAKKGGPSLKTRALTFVQPALIVETSLKPDPIVFAPYGVPARNYTTEIGVGAAVVIGFALYGVGTLLWKIVR